VCVRGQWLVVCSGAKMLQDSLNIPAACRHNLHPAAPGL